MESESRSYEMMWVRNANGANLSLSFNVIASLPGICTYNDEKAIKYMADIQKRKQSLVYPMLCILEIFSKPAKLKLNVQSEVPRNSLLRKAYAPTRNSSDYY